MEDEARAARDGNPGECALPFAPFRLRRSADEYKEPGAQQRGHGRFAQAVRGTGGRFCRLEAYWEILGMVGRSRFPATSTNCWSDVAATTKWE